MSAELPRWDAQTHLPQAAIKTLRLSVSARDNNASPLLGHPLRGLALRARGIRVKKLPHSPFPLMKTVDHVCSAFLRRILRRMKQLGT